MSFLRSRALYSLLFLYIGISLTYQIVASVSLIVGYFDLRHQVQTPFSVDFERPILTDVTESGKLAGLANGDRIESINGIPYTGRAQWQKARWYAHPGDKQEVGVRRPDGTRAIVSVPLEGYSRGGLANERLNDIHIGEAAFVIFLQIVVPLFCLALGYWVVLARPKDIHAWLILILLSFPEAFISVSTYNWWPGVWLPLRLAWHIILIILAPGALLWLGLLFPERSRIDFRLPSLKWLVGVILLIGIVVSLTTDYSAWYNLALIPNRPAIDHINDKVLNWAMVFCLVLYWVAILDKLRTTSTPDARRRLHVLLAGSVVGLGNILIVWGVLPLFGIADPAGIQWLGYVSATLMLALPLSLAYVVIVQRAMDVRILLRMGTKYALARGTLVVLRAVLVVVLLIFLVQEIRTPEFTLATIGRIVICAAILLFASSRVSVSGQLSRWIDHKFFREAYNAEMVLSELSEQVPAFTDSKPLIETVARKVSETLHVSQMAVLLRSSEDFQLREAIGLPSTTLWQLSSDSSAVRHLGQTKRPVTLYRENPDEWFRAADESERSAFEAMNAELLLALPGRQKLMGVMALGPKRSDEPYSPSDLRLLQSIGVQTGLALEASELAHSLATEAAHRARISREIEIAREVQERLFPQHIPSYPGFTVAGACRPAQGVGGDYYDVIELDDGRLGLAIGDVSGKGVSASLLMASLRACLRTMMLVEQTDLAKLMQKMNQLVYESSAVNRYATFFFSIYDPSSRELRYVNAGHNPPFLLRSSANGRPKLVRLEAGGPVIGLLPSVSYEEQSLILQADDLLFAYTDGISEAMTEGYEEWGEERMLIAAESVQHHAADHVLQSLFSAADQFTGSTPQHDDMTVLILKLD
ncbi:MAG TPA: SpoIIE family protein phosphatase [Bryobacteraceae bacterium]|nr:SpoIIE family protein phosphatase [Bryobacteraceae bacterium]